MEIIYEIDELHRKKDIDSKKIYLSKHYGIDLIDEVLTSNNIKDEHKTVIIKDIEKE